MEHPRSQVLDAVARNTKGGITMKHEDVRKMYYDWSEDLRHDPCHACGIVHGCPGCPVYGSNPDCPTKEEMKELEEEEK